MGSIYRKVFTKPMPDDAKRVIRKGQPCAEWIDARGRRRVAPITETASGTRIRVKASTYTAKYRDGQGVVREVATGCRDEVAARAVLAALERRGELVKAEVITPAEAAAADHQQRPIDEHVADYMESLKSRGTSRAHLSERRRQLVRLVHDLGIVVLADLRRESLERWLNQRQAEGMGARTRNTYSTSMKAFCGWLSDPAIGRLSSNPIARVAMANEKADPRHQRRALTEDELSKLLAVAQRRPLESRLARNRGPNKGMAGSRLSDATRANLEALGRERALIYKTLVMTGLRRGELASLTVANLDAEQGLIDLDAGSEKSRQGNLIPLRPDLLADLRAWLAEKLDRHQMEARDAGNPIPMRLPPAEPLFTIPEKLSKIMNRDIRDAGISKRDDRGRVIDVHALRHTFGTFLSKGGVAPRVAQAAMRHANIGLTMNVYTDPRLLDVVGAMDALPELPLAGEAKPAPKTGEQNA